MKKKKALYIHIPFCLSKCPYCDFYSIKFNTGKALAYKNAVIRNLREYDETYDTVYFGGGTPILMWREIPEILSACDIAPDAEITVEANPCCCSEKILSSLRNAGVNRLSLGIQSMCGSELETLGRKHTAKRAENAVLIAKEVGFDNISADIMTGTPAQTKATLNETLDRLSALPLTHISSYMLKIEEGTPFAQDNILPAQEEISAEMYLLTVEKLKNYGFKQYEISNFAKAGFECRHNIKYWNCDEYVGIGASAHSFYGGKRFAAERDVDSFIEAPVQKTTITDEYPASFEEYAMLRLRLCDGLYFSECEKRNVMRAEILERTKLIPKEYFNLSPDKISLTPRGFLVANHIIGKLLGY